MKWTNELSRNASWGKTINNRKQKEMVAKKLALRLKSGDVVGVGSGSTSYLTLLALAARRDKEGTIFTAITTSIEMELVCAALSIPVTLLRVERPDWSFDGADEVDAQHNLIKGRGGALLREKMLIQASPEAYIVIDISKHVIHLGQKCAVPLEIHADAIDVVHTALAKIKEVKTVVLRQAVAKDGPVITENGNLILDVMFSQIPIGMEKQLKCIVGVVESGLFQGYPIKLV